MNINVSICYFSSFALLQTHPEAFLSFQNDIGLQSELALAQIRINTEIPQNSRQDDLQLQHGVFATFEHNYQLEHLYTIKNI